MGIKQSDWLRSLSISNVCNIPGDVQRIGHQSKWLTLVNFTFLRLILLEKEFKQNHSLWTPSLSLSTFCKSSLIIVLFWHVVCVFFKHALPLNSMLYLVQSSKNRFPGTCYTKPTKRRRALSTTPSKLEARIRSFSYKFKPYRQKSYFSISI